MSQVSDKVKLNKMRHSIGPSSKISSSSSSKHSKTTNKTGVNHKKLTKTLKKEATPQKYQELQFSPGKPARTIRDLEEKESIKIAIQKADLSVENSKSSHMIKNSKSKSKSKSGSKSKNEEEVVDNADTLTDI
jgi:hypothetical protein